MATQPYTTCALPEGLRYYLLRVDQTRGSMMVPLVPVDQLPFQLQGIPHQLTHRQVSDGDWKLCSETNKAPSALLIQAPTATSFISHPSPTAKPRYLAPDHYVRAEPQTMPTDYSCSPQSSHHPPAVVNTPKLSRPKPTTAILGRPSSLTDTFASIYQKDAQHLGYHAPHPSGIEPDPSKKEYCTYWIKTGECDWTAIGCKFKHEMPSVEKLRELGFVRGIPRWWKEKSAIVARPPTWMQRRLAENDGAEQAGEMPEPKVFPDPSMFRMRRGEGRDLLGKEVLQPRGTLKRDSSPKHSTVGRSTPPPAPVQGPVRRASQMSDLLIDLEDTPAPPPSPQLSHTSAASAGSSEAQVSSRSSVSSPSSPSVERNLSLLIDCKSPPKSATKKTPERGSSIRRHSQLSCDSDTEDDTPILTNPNSNAKTPRATQQRRNPPLRSNNNNRHPIPTRTTPTKSQPGLASSKHVTSDNAARNTTSRGRNNTNRKMHGESEGEVGALELYAKIEQLRREAHRSDKARKAAVAAVAVVGR